MMTGIGIGCMWKIGDSYQQHVIANCDSHIRDHNGTSILLFSDVHIFGDSVGSWFKQVTTDVYMSGLIKNMRSFAQPDYVIHLGDAMDEAHEVFTNEKQYSSYAKRFKSVTGNIDINVVGNHDIGWPTIDIQKLSYYREYIGPDTGITTLQINNKSTTFAFVNTMSNVITCPTADIILTHYPLPNGRMSCPNAKRLFYGHTHVFKTDGVEVLIGTINPLKVLGIDVPEGFNKSSGMAIWEPETNMVYTCLFSDTWRWYWIISILTVLYLTYIGIGIYLYILIRNKRKLSRSNHDTNISNNVDTNITDGNDYAFNILQGDPESIPSTPVSKCRRFINFYIDRCIYLNVFKNFLFVIGCTVILLIFDDEILVTVSSLVICVIIAELITCSLPSLNILAVCGTIMIYWIVNYATQTHFWNNR
jgi:predicted phosphodiesterase